MRFQQCKNCKNRLKFVKVTESVMVATFLRHSVEKSHGSARGREASTNFLWFAENIFYFDHWMA